MTYFALLLQVPTGLAYSAVGACCLHRDSCWELLLGVLGMVVGHCCSSCNCSLLQLLGAWSRLNTRSECLLKLLLWLLPSAWLSCRFRSMMICCIRKLL